MANDKKFDAALADLQAKSKERSFSITRLADPETLARVEHRISTRCMALDAITAGGYPIRRITEIYGDSTTGKTLLCTDAVIETQDIGGMAAYADAEIAVGVERMEDLGVDGAKLAYADVNTIDDVFDFLDDCIEVKNKHFGKAAPLTFVWDSVAAIATKDEMEKKAKDGYEGQDYPRAAIYISAAMRVTPRKVAENNVCLLLVNQVRENIGVLYGNKKSTYGGKAIEFYSSLRLELSLRQKIQNAVKDVIGIDANIKVVKNRLAPPFREAIIPIYYAYGIDEPMATLEFLKFHKLVEHSRGSTWYTLNGDKFQKKTFPKFFDDHYDEIADLLEGYYAQASQS